jgi:ADP-heptose:LPS heptosyltransferase
MGDLIQTIGLVKSLHKKGYEVDFLCVKAFSKILEYVPEIKKIIRIDADNFLKNSPKNVFDKYFEIEELVDSLNKNNYSLLVNPVASIPSAYLSFIIKAKEKKGIIFTETREQSIQSKWSAFHLANEHNLGDHGFNLVDIFAGVGNCKIPKDDYQMESAGKTDFGIKNNLPKVGFHIGASKSNKTWEKEKFKKVILQLLNAKCCNIILFGGYSELSLNPFFADISSNLFINRIGKTGLDELISEISSLNLLVTNDTGPMHIAAIQKIPIIDISLGPVSLWETSPYFENCLILEANIQCHPCKFSYVCSHLSCHHLIQENHLWEAIKYKLNLDNNLEENSSVNYFQTKFDPAGYLHNVPLFKKNISNKDLFFELKRLIWILSLDYNLENDFQEKYLRYLKNYYNFENINLEFKEYEEIKAEINYLLEKLSELKNIKFSDEKEIDRIKRTWTDVKRIKENIFDVRNKNDIYDFFLFAKFRESSINSFNIKTLISETIDIYELLHFQINSLIKLLMRCNNESLS